LHRASQDPQAQSGGTEAGNAGIVSSQFRHGTVPFEDGGRRLAAAFEVILPNYPT